MLCSACIVDSIHAAKVCGQLYLEEPCPSIQHRMWVIAISVGWSVLQKASNALSFPNLSFYKHGFAKRIITQASMILLLNLHAGQVEQPQNLVNSTAEAATA